MADDNDGMESVGNASDLHRNLGE